MTDEDTTQTTEPAPAPEANVEPDREELGDGGRKALDVERQGRKTAEREAREARERLAALEAAELRRDVAAEKNLSAAQAAFLTAADRDAMGAQADALLEAFAPPADDDVRRRPQERLKSGAVPSAEPRDVGSIADEVMRG